MEIFEVKFTNCVYESAYATISTHKTNKGAYKTLNKFLNETYKDWQDNRTLYGKLQRGEKCFDMCRYYIKKTILLD